ncbi:MAG TPA: divalent-cation tolerance protein CutA [Rhodocyclaceae bacterium]|nr:divalent-cation tolerance protein CutA [Rhodocyclaceae bacterium]
MIASPHPSEILIVLTSLPDAVSAQKLAALLIERHLAACVNILAPCQSVYRWQGKVEQATEIPLLIKTTANVYTALEACIRAQHPYELPEIIAVPIDCGLPEYLGWVAAETLSDTSDMPTAAHTSPC